jgi:hypothetical protein
MDTDLRDAARQALMALDWYAECAMVSDKAADAASALRAALAQPEQAEPVACSNTFACRCPKHYTHPPRREWRGLTEEEVDQMAGNTVDAWECARAVEAALKERNA